MPACSPERERDAASHLSFEGPYLWKSGGIAVDSKGRLCIADFDNFQVRRVGTNGVISAFAGTGQYTSRARTSKGRRRPPSTWATRTT